MTIEARGISKVYPRKAALKDVSATFGAGKIHMLLGQNGAGKSTLASIIAGITAPTDGTLLFDGKEVRLGGDEGARTALERGIAMVHQRPLLASALTATENLRLTGTPARVLADTLPRLTEAWAPGLPHTVPVRNLGGNLRFYVALIAALLHRPRCLILDEPSAFLDSGERARLYQKLREQADAGSTIIVITHSTAEAQAYADTMTVLHEGTLRASFRTPAECRSAPVATLMGHRELTAPDGTPAQDSPQHPGTAKAPSAAQDCLSLAQVSCRPRNRPALLSAALRVRYGQITAVSGLTEAALDTLEATVTGMAGRTARGSATFCDRGGTSRTIDLASGRFSTAFLRRHGTAIVPSDKTFLASHPALTIEQLLCTYLRRGNPTNHARELIRRAGVDIAPEDFCRELSGGMLQRLILARELSLEPQLLILCNPMQGLDVRSQGRLVQQVLSAAQRGTAVLVIGAADFPLSLCARVYALEGGRTTLAFAREPA